MLEPRVVVNQCYILQERLGEDSFAELWRASSIYSATQFLIRFIKTGKGLEQGTQAFRKRAMDCYSITAPAVMDFVEIERMEDRLFIASEFDGQKCLLSHFGDLHQIKLEHACRFIIELGTGLDAFHKRGLLYGCLNAENVLVTSQAGMIESIKVQKPGYLPFLPYLDGKDAKGVFENWSYMAPELKPGLAGAAEASASPGAGDRRSDIYSLAVHLFRFIVGKLPYSTAKRAREGAVSLPYVSRAFARRGVPAAVTRVALKALRKDPAQRPSDVLELIAELRAFIDERRRELLARGEVDPVAELVTLNLDKDRIDATQAVKSLDTADYFRQLSQAWLQPAQSGPARYFPVNDFADPGEVARIEDEEAEGEADDGRASIDSYIEEAVRTVKGEPASRRTDWTEPEPAVPAHTRASEPAPAPVPAEPAEARGSGGGRGQAKKEGPSKLSEPASTEEAVMPPAPQDLDSMEGVNGIGDLLATKVDLALGKEPIGKPRAEAAIPQPVTMGAFASDPGPARRRKNQVLPVNVNVGGISWRPDLALPEAVVAGMESAFSRSFKGTGAFRFIQEPPTGPGAAAFARVFATFRARGLVADLGTLPPKADATDLLRLMRSAMVEGLGYESPQARTVLAKRLRLCDAAGSLTSAPLGNLLLGQDAGEPDPEWLDSIEGAMSAAVAVASMGRRRRPLVLSMRGGEVVGRSCHALLMEMARLAPIASFCCFVFYKPGPVPSWHVLSKLGSQ